jgi:predicted unusual protein kinase regulating ubiquinone biosynthesis (AarF/ABC1/UbiB family)
MTSTAPTVPVLRRPAARRFRVLRAYGAALRIGASYLAFAAWTRLRGARWAGGARPALHQRNGRRARRAILRLRGLFIKAGQLASILTTFLPEPFRVELDGLQDQVPAGPFDAVRRRIESELGAPLGGLFATFDEAPLASASLAQVHRATLHDGRAVAVKVQHADIEAIARLDLRAIETILRVVGRAFGIRGLREQFQQIEAIIEEELDFRQEARNRELVAESLGRVRGLAVPEVIPERSAQRVLTTTFAPGIKAGDLAALDAAGIGRTALAERLVAAYGRMIFADGVYHADPHPGNLLVQPDGTLVVLDFGAVARLTPEMRRGLAEFIVAVTARDAARVTASLATMGFVPSGGAPSEAVATLVERIHARVLRDIDPMAFRLGDLAAASTMAAQMDALGEMADLGVSLRDLAGAYQVPRDWILLERTALLLIGLLTALAPDLNPLRLLWPWVQPLVAESAPSLGASVADSVRTAVQSWLGLPASAARVLEAVEAGEVSVRVPDTRASAELLYAAAHQIVYALVAVGAGAVAYAARVHGDAGLALALGLASALCAAALAGSMLRVRGLRRRTRR